MKLTFQGVHYKTLFTKFTVQVQDHFLYRFARDIAESDELRHVYPICVYFRNISRKEWLTHVGLSAECR